MKFRVAVGMLLAVSFLQGGDPSKTDASKARWRQGFFQSSDAPGAAGPEQDSRLVNLNVVAVDNHGDPIADLAASDFEVTDNGKKQTIAFFRHNDSKLWRTPKLAPNEFSNRGGPRTTRATVILFDLLNESFSTRGVAWNQLVHNLEAFESADALYLYILTLEGRLYAVHGFESEEGEPAQGKGAPWTSQIKPLMDNAMRAVMRVRPVDIDVAVRVQITFAALDMLAVQMSRVPGRKNIVWVTDGVPIELGPNRSDTGDFADFTQELRQLSEHLDLSGVSVYPVGQIMLGSSDTVGSNSRDSAAGSMTGGSGGVSSAETLNQVAALTGGRPNSGKDIGSAVKQAMTDVRTSYQIGYYVPLNNWNGKFHKIKVKSARKGARIQAQSGYYAWPGPPDAEANQAIKTAMGTTFDAAEIGLHGSLTMDPSGGGKARFDARIDAGDIVLANEGDQYSGQLRVEMIGYVAGNLMQRSPVVPLDIQYTAAQRDQALKDGIAFTRDLVIDKEMTKLRLIVCDSGSNAIGSLTIPIQRPSPAAAH